MMTQQIMALPSMLNELPSNRIKAGHYRPTHETPFKLRFAGGPIVGRDYMLTGYRTLQQYGYSNIYLQMQL